MKSTYIYELFINLLTVIYDPWLDLMVVSLGIFLSFFLDFVSVNVTVHILNTATCWELPGRQLGARPVTRGRNQT